MQSPCYNCQDRHLGCFGKCDRYKAFQAYRQQVNAERAKMIRADADVSVTKKAYKGR